MKKVIKILCLTALVILSSCATRKDFIYLQDMNELQEYPVIQKYEAVIHRDDKLSIIVNSKTRNWLCRLTSRVVTVTSPSM